MLQTLALTELPIKGKRVLMRVDFNVPLNEKGEIADDTRIRAALPSIRYVLDGGGKLVLMSHLGRPKGRVVPELSLKPCAERLGELLGREVELRGVQDISSVFQDLEFSASAFPAWQRSEDRDKLGEKVIETEDTARLEKPKQKNQNLENDRYTGSGDVVLLENLRFHPGEEKPEVEPEFVEQLKKWGDCYVNDAFGTAHRAHASTVLLAKCFPGQAACGLLMEKEVTFLGEKLKDPERPFYALIGGAKVSTKFGVLKALLEKVDALFIGGGMSYTFFKAMGYPIGESICEEAFVEQAKGLLTLAKERGVELHLPDDCVGIKGGEREVFTFPPGVQEGFEGMDIGPQTIARYSEELVKGKTILWNGPVGVFEMEAFSKGTFALAEVLAKSGLKCIVGGGDSVAAIKKAGLEEHFAHLSTGGGASLEFIEYGTLPGIEALTH